MSVSDKIVAIVGVVTCVTMLAAGWVGEKAFAAIFSKKDPIPTPEKNAEIHKSRKIKVKRSAVLLLLLLEGIAVLLLSWRMSLNHPLNFRLVVQVGIGVSAVQFSILGYFIGQILEMLNNYHQLSRNLMNEIEDHFSLLKTMASEIDKKANSRKKSLSTGVTQPPSN